MLLWRAVAVVCRRVADDALIPAFASAHVFVLESVAAISDKQVGCRGARQKSLREHAATGVSRLANDANVQHGLVAALCLVVVSREWQW